MLYSPKLNTIDLLFSTETSLGEGTGLEKKKKSPLHT